MKIHNIHSELKFANRIGATLSIDERTGLELAVLKLAEEKPFETYNFWGRIEGLTRNYYIVQGVNVKGKYDFPQKEYFWSSEGFKFAELPKPRWEYKQQTEALRDFFSGQHEKIISHTSQAPKKTISKATFNQMHFFSFHHNNLESGDEDLVITAKNFTELDRLSLVVHLIEINCQVVPLGALKLTPTHELIANPFFKGLKIDEAANPAHYVHFRKPTIPENVLLVESDQALHRLDFLDSIDKDPIKGSWSIQSDQSHTQVTVRSLLWPGYVSYHRTNSNVYGGVYFGDGIKNSDLPFLIN